ncbi:MAG: hypothetical protein ACQEQI_03890 [Bacillota bacterium]
MKKLKQESKLIYKLVNQKITRQEYVQALIDQYQEHLKFGNQ